MKHSAAELIELALIYAIQDRESFADANHDGSEERKEALALAREFRAYHRKRFKKAHLNEMERLVSTATYVTLADLRRQKGDA